LAWATEAQERGIISEKETKDIKFTWGDYSSYIKAVQFIFKQPNQFYETLARGGLNMLPNNTEEKILPLLLVGTKWRDIIPVRLPISAF
ncbi:MAG: hypothetical protein KAH35_01755, partial [Candidatus Atribacteria bacterium]|nr:hypothetical protein [Candidatus Atribacteria bacterium]